MPHAPEQPVPIAEPQPVEPVVAPLMALMTMTFSMFPLLGRTPPPWEWTGGSMVTCLATHAAYIGTAAATDDLLRRALYSRQA